MPQDVAACRPNDESGFTPLPPRMNLTVRPSLDATLAREASNRGRTPLDSVGEDFADQPTGQWSDGCGELLPFCPECATREFAPGAPASGQLPRAQRRATNNSDS